MIHWAVLILTVTTSIAVDLMSVARAVQRLLIGTESTKCQRLCGLQIISTATVAHHSRTRIMPRRQAQRDKLNLTLPVFPIGRKVPRVLGISGSASIVTTLKDSLRPTRPFRGT